jgi:hypothetical protein
MRACAASGYMTATALSIFVGSRQRWHYSDVPLPSEARRLWERWHGIVQRNDVQKAIVRVGRIVDVALPMGSE